MVLICDLKVPIQENKDLVQGIYDLFHVETGKCSQEAILKRKELHKPDLANEILCLVRKVKESTEYLENSVSEIERLQNETKEFNRFSKKLEKNIEKIDAVATEIKTYAKVLNSGTPPTSLIVSDEIKTIVNKTLDEHDEKIEKRYNLVITGVEDNDSSRLELIEEVQVIIDEVSRLSGHDVPHKIVTGHYIGKRDPTFNRPIRVKFDNPEISKIIVNNAHLLKSNMEYRGVYISPDCTSEEQKIHSMLVKQLKEMISEVPDKFWFIRNGKVDSRPHRPTRRNTVSRIPG